MLRQTALATGATAGGAAETVIGDANRAADEIFIAYLRQVTWPSGDLHFEHLIEIAVVQIAVPIDRHHGATHQAVDRLRVETCSEFLHILQVLAAAQQIVQVTTDRHVGNRK